MEKTGITELKKLCMLIRNENQKPKAKNQLFRKIMLGIMPRAGSVLPGHDFYRRRNGSTAGTFVSRRRRWKSTIRKWLFDEMVSVKWA